MITKNQLLDQYATEKQGPHTDFEILGAKSDIIYKLGAIFQL